MSGFLIVAVSRSTGIDIDEAGMVIKGDGCLHTIALRGIYAQGRVGQYHADRGYAFSVNIRKHRVCYQRSGSALSALYVPCRSSQG